MQLSTRIRTVHHHHWVCLFAGVVLAWVVLFVLSVPADLRTSAQVYGPDFWRNFCVVTPDMAGFAKVVAMWALMGVAMMLPGFVPAVATYDDLSHTQAVGRDGMAQLIGGYLLIWAGFAVVAAAAQMALTALGWVSPIGTPLSRGLSVVLLALAGLYQFSAFKDACLSKCRQPLTFFMQHWSSARFNSFYMGLRLGGYCLGCCWALMALGFVGGTMNLAWMGLATLLMTVEKLPAFGRYLTRPLGVVLLCGAAGFAVF